MQERGLLRRNHGPWLAILLVWLGMWWPVIFGGRRFFMRDLTFFAAPMKQFMLSELQAGRFPFWAPHLSAGMPFFAEITNQVLYPFNLLFWVVPGIFAALSWFVLLHLLLGQMAFYRLARTLGCTRDLSVWAALVFGLSGYTLSITDNVNYLPAVLWVPAGLAWFIRGLQKQNPVAARRYTALSALATAAMLLAGDTLNPMILALVCGLMLVWRWRSPGWPPGLPGRAALGHWVVSFGLGGLLAAVQILPTMQLVGVSVRQHALAASESALWAFPPQRLVELIHPFFYGSTAPFPHFIGMFMYPVFVVPWADSVFIGVIPVGLALVGWLFRFRHCGFWGMVVLLSLGVGMAGALGALPLLIKLFPPLGYHRYLEKMVFWTTLGMVLSAVMAAQAWRRQGILSSVLPSLSLPIKLAMTALLAWGMTFALLTYPVKAWIFPHANEWSIEWGNHAYDRAVHVAGLYRHWWFMLGACLAGLWVKASWRARYANALLLLALVDLLWAHAGHTPLAPAGLLEPSPPPAIVGALKGMGPHPRLYYDDQLVQNTPLAIPGLLKTVAQSEGLPSVPQDAYPFIWPYRMRYYRDRLGFNYGQFYGFGYLNGRLQPLQPLLHQRMNAGLRTSDAPVLLSLCGVQAVITAIDPLNLRWKPDAFDEIGRDEELNYRVLRPKVVLPRAYMVPQGVWMPVDGPGSRRLAEVFPSPQDLRRRVILSQGPHLPERASQTDSFLEVATSLDLPGRIQLRPPGPGWLVVTESWFPGWRAVIDGSPVTLYLANKRMMAIYVPKGSRQAILQYRCEPFQAGIVLSLVGLALAGWLLKSSGPIFRRNSLRTETPSGWGGETGATTIG